MLPKLDLVFTKLLIPEGNKNTIIVQPTGKMFTSGLAYSYSTEYPKQLEDLDLISEEDYIDAMISINEDI